MKHILNLIILFIIATVALGQNKQKRADVKPPHRPSDSEFFSFDGYQLNLQGVLGPAQYGVTENDIEQAFIEADSIKRNAQMKRIPALHRTPPFTFKSPIMLGAKPSAGNWGAVLQVSSFLKQFASRTVSDSAYVDVVALGINAKNVNDYRYHVVVNDSIELVPWSVPQLKQFHGAKQPYGYLGRYREAGKQLMIEVVNTKNYSIRDGLVFTWGKFNKPILTNILVDTSRRRPDLMFDLGNIKKNAGYATQFDGALPLNLRFPVDSVNGLELVFKDHPLVPYDIYWTDLGGELVHVTPETPMIKYEMKDNRFYLDKQYFGHPGKYEVIIKPTYGKGDDQTLTLKFEVTDPTHRWDKLSFYMIWPILLTALIFIAACFLIFYIYNKRKLKNAEQQKALTDLKLKSVRSQLNPHFMFNALTSIQNLMNQQDTKGANHYLSKFAALTRHVLNTSAQEMVSLADEVKLMNDYLQMEQLRFGFEYKIDVDANINQANTDIPNMLLQPFIENAAKHGVSALQNKGKIMVSISKQNRDLIMKVADNGPGLGKGSNTGNGVGIKLSEERIALLNQMYKGQPIIMKVDSTTPGLSVIIKLTNWL